MGLEFHRVPESVTFSEMLAVSSPLRIAGRMEGEESVWECVRELRSNHLLCGYSHVKICLHKGRLGAAGKMQTVM